jgi:hypothetical protein
MHTVIETTFVDVSGLHADSFQNSFGREPSDGMQLVFVGNVPV